MALIDVSIEFKGSSETTAQPIRVIQASAVLTGAGKAMGARRQQPEPVPQPAEPKTEV